MAILNKQTGIIVTEEDVDQAVAYLGDSVAEIGNAKGRVVKAEALLRHVKAVNMTFSSENAISAQERDAYASDAYRQAIQEFRDATVDYEVLKAKREHAALVIGVWQTQSSNIRALRI